MSDDRRSIDHLVSEHNHGDIITLSRHCDDGETDTVAIAFVDELGTALVAEFGGHAIGGMSVTLRGFAGDDSRKPLNLFTAPDGTIMVTLD